MAPPGPGPSDCAQPIASELIAAIHAPAIQPLRPRVFAIFHRARPVITNPARSIIKAEGGSTRILTRSNEASVAVVLNVPFSRCTCTENAITICRLAANAPNNGTAVLEKKISVAREIHKAGIMKETSGHAKSGAMVSVKTPKP